MCWTLARWVGQCARMKAETGGELARWMSHYTVREEGWKWWILYDGVPVVEGEGCDVFSALETIRTAHIPDGLLYAMGAGSGKYPMNDYNYRIMRVDGGFRWAAVIMRVEGGFHAYESVEDYKTAKRQV